MDTENQNRLSSMLHMQAGAPVIGENTCIAENACGPLDSLSEGSQRLLRDLAQDGGELSLALEARLDSLQESFMDLLNGQMISQKLTSEHRLHLCLSPEGRLVVEGGDTDAEKLCEVISRKPALQKRFQELARLALLSRGVEVARQAHSALLEEESEAENPLFSSYHMCLKGSLSHFYLR